MDGISEDSPLSSVLSLWDHIETVIEEHPRLPYYVGVIFAYIALSGGHDKLRSCVVFFCWFNRAYILHFIKRTAPSSIIVSALCAVSAAGLIFYRSRWGNSRSREGHTSPDISYMSPNRISYPKPLPAKAPRENQGRHGTATEKSLEAVFRAYLRSLIEESPVPLMVQYVPSGITERGEETFRSPSADHRLDEREQLQLKVLTPIFYSRFVGYAHDFEAIFCELAESGTLWADKPDVLPKLFLKKPSPPLHAASVVDYLTFKLIKRLRRRPEAIRRPGTSATRPAPGSQAVDIRDFRMSPMDAFVLGQKDTRLKVAYRSSVMRLFLANEFFFGCTTFLELMGTLWAIAVGYTLALLLARVTLSLQHDIT